MSKKEDGGVAEALADSQAPTRLTAEKRQAILHRRMLAVQQANIKSPKVQAAIERMGRIFVAEVN